MKKTKNEIMVWTIIILSFLSSLYFYNNFPQKVATHWNFRGEVDGYSDKFSGAFAIPILLTGIYILFKVLPLIDPNKKRYQEFNKVYDLIRCMILGVLFLVYIISGLYNIGYPIKVGIITPTVIGLMMIIMGNFMGKLKRNWFVGIKTPWTIASENVWNKTHRLGGYAFIFFGLCIIISPFLTETLGVGLFTLGATTSIAGPIVYSYFEYKKEKLK